MISKFCDSHHIMLISSIALNMEMTPKDMNRVDVPIFNHFIGRREASFVPMTMAIPVSKAKAMVIPTNTRKGDVSAPNAMVVS